MGHSLTRERLFLMQPIPSLHWDVGETCRLFMRSLFINIQAVILSIQNWRPHQPFLCAMALSFGPVLSSVIPRQPGL